MKIADVLAAVGSIGLTIVMIMAAYAVFILGRDSVNTSMLVLFITISASWTGYKLKGFVDGVKESRITVG